MSKPSTIICTTALLLIGIACPAGATASAGDWPQWRYDAGRTAASPEELRGELHLQWTRHLAAPKPAWRKYPRMRFDASYEPVVAGKTMFVPSMVTDSLTALDSETGAEKWKFYTDGPVRLAPVAFNGKVAFVSDDGHLYCLDAADGRLLWKFRGLPSDRADRRVLGNDRLISLWPARGGPVLADGRIYFAAGVWPFEGVYVHAVEAETGKRVWSNKDAGHIRQGLIDHTTRQAAGLSPQGYLARIADKLFVPSGRALSAVLDPETGKLQPYSTGWGGRDNMAKGCWYVAGRGKYFFQSGDLYESATGKRLQIDPANAKELGQFREPVLAAGAAYFSRPINRPRGYRPVGAGYDRMIAWDLAEPPELKSWEDQQGRKWPAAALKQLWALAGDLHVHIKSGPRLYGGSDGAVAAVDLPKQGGAPKITWRARIEGTPSRMLSADGKLFVVTREGTIYAFGPEKVQPRIHGIAVPNSVAASEDRWTRTAGEVLQRTGAKGGYCLVLGLGSGRLAAELAAQSELHVVAVDPDPAKVRRLRRRLDEAGLYGRAVAVLVGHPLSCPLPPYLATLVVSEGPGAIGLPPGEHLAKKVFRLLRPYGGVACLPMPADRQDVFVDSCRAAGLANARARRAGGFVLLERFGPLPGSADWTHEDADGAGSLVSRDKRVKPPLGVLWFGGAVDMLFPPWDFTHSRPPTPLVAGGRMFFQVFPRLHAMDIYTGRHLWTVTMPGTDRNPQRRNIKYAAAADSLYVVSGKTCHRIDPASGSTIAKLESPVDGRPGGWREIRLWRGCLIGASGNVLVCMDRRSGETKWTYPARRGLVAFAVGGGKVFCADGSLLTDRRGTAPRAPNAGKGMVIRFQGTITALDVRGGKQAWQVSAKLPGPKRSPLRLAYSAEQEILIVACGPVRAYQGKDGTLLWSDKAIGGSDQPMLHHDRLITQTGEVHELRTGSRLPRLWDLNRRGCTRVIGGEHLLSIRHGHASYLDLASGRQTFFRGVRAGCTNGLIAADGLLSAPNFSHGCSCNYAVFSSLALVPAAEAAP